ncbi:nucleoside-diphosphate kinase [Thermococci archaeon]|nr:MAG: nucleoside-diphosphate kinase [Thermococci archaeon]RLF97424.1 MAG: nucleoside-diphosphate kinase [Thermococci archaeon]
MYLRTFVMIKPDGVQRGLIGEIISRFEKRGLKIVAMKLVKISRDLAERQYEMHKGKKFYDGLIEYITSSPAVVMVVEGKGNVVELVRRMVGSTDPSDASPGTIRGDLSLEIGRNVIHAADSEENAEREISIYFSPDEILSYKRIDEEWLYEG